MQTRLARSVWQRRIRFDPNRSRAGWCQAISSQHQLVSRIGSILTSHAIFYAMRTDFAEQAFQELILPSLDLKLGDREASTISPDLGKQRKTHRLLALS